MDKSKLHICIVTPQKSVYSETFISEQIRRLPGRIFHVYATGGAFPIFDHLGNLLVREPSFFQKVKRSLLSRLLKFDFGEQKLRIEAFKNYLKLQKIDVVLAQFAPTGDAIKDICKELGIPLVVHFHGYDAYEYETLKKYRNYADLFAIASAIIVVSKDMEKQIRSLGAPAHKVHYLPYGTDCSLFSNAKPLNSSQLFVSVGRFVDKKAPYLTLMALKQVLDKCPSTRLIMFGDGPLLEMCRHFVKAINISHAVEFKGVCSQEEIAKVIKLARGFLQHSIKTSYGDTEGTPVSILEAGAAGLPVVSTYHAGIPDAVMDGKSGFLVSEEDFNSMAKAIIKLALDPELAEEMGQAAHEHIKSNFNINQSINRLYSVIESTVKRL